MIELLSQGVLPAVRSSNFFNAKQNRTYFKNMWYFPYEFLQSFKNSLELLAESEKKFKDIEKVSNKRAAAGLWNEILEK